MSKFITGTPNGPVLFCSLASVVVVCNTAGARASRRARGRPTLHGGPVVLRPIRATPCIYLFCTITAEIKRKHGKPVTRTNT